MDESYRRYTGPKELSKTVNTLRGLIAGISADRSVGDAEMRELVCWIKYHDFGNRHPFTEIQKAIEMLEKNDGMDLSFAFWLITSLSSQEDNRTKDYDFDAATRQFLEGMLHGMIADGDFNDDEIIALCTWLNVNDEFNGYPYDKLRELAPEALQSDDARKQLHKFSLSMVQIDASANYSGDECAEAVIASELYDDCDVSVNGSSFCFTGAFSSGTKQEIGNRIKEQGGIISKYVTSKTGYLVVGNFGSPSWSYQNYGEKVEKAMALKDKGKNIKIISECKLLQYLNGDE